MPVAPLSSPAVEARIASLLHATHPESWRAATARADACAPGHDEGRIGATAGNPSQYPAAQRRAALEAHAAELGRANLVRTLAEQPELPGACVAARALGEFAREHGPGSTAWLVGRLEGFVASDRAELEAIGAELDALVASGERHLGPGDLRGRVERAHALESRLPARQAALDGFRAAFPGKVRESVGKSADALTAALAEVYALEDRLPSPDPGIEQDERELASIDARLAKLGVVVGIAPGPISTGMKALRDQVARRVADARAGHAKQVRDTIKGVVERTLAGDLDSWAAIADAVARHVDAFPAGLAGRLPAAGLEALVASGPIGWRDALEGAVRDGKGRDYPHTAPEPA